jgi:hypothetical protein
MMVGSEDQDSRNYIWQILQYPVMGCVVLLGLYFVLKKSEEIALDTLLNLAFVIVVVVHCSSQVHKWSLSTLQLCDL